VRATVRQLGAFAVSAVAHLALFVAVVAAVRPAPSRRPLEVRLVQLASPAPREAAGRALSVAEPSVSKSRMRALVALTRRPAISEVLPIAAAPPEPIGGAGPPRPGALEGGPGGEDGAGGTSEAGAGEASLLGELHRRLADAATRCYPPAARRLRLRGEVPLHFCLDAAGSATALSLEGSTGSALLDRSALECVVPGAAPLPGVVGCFQVPVRFGG
jgi:periplasmic protein TonB